MRFLFDVHLHAGASGELRRRGVDVTHAGEDPELRELSDPLLLDRSAGLERILVTRNYRDYAPLVRRLAREGRRFPGVLFVPSSIGHADAGALVRALLRWIDEVPPGANPVADTSGWLRP